MTEYPGTGGLTATNSAAYARHEGHVRLRDVMLAEQCLPGNYRSVRLPVSVENLWYPNVVQEISTPSATVMSRLARVKESMRKHFEDK